MVVMIVRNEDIIRIMRSSPHPERIQINNPFIGSDPYAALCQNLNIFKYCHNLVSYMLLYCFFPHAASSPSVHDT